MALPSAFHTVRVYDTFTGPDGTPETGRVSFTPRPAVLTSAASGVQVLGTTTATLDATGAFSVSLLATDDPLVDPVGWTYDVVVAIDGQDSRTFPLSLPLAAPVVALAAVAPASATAGTYAVITGPAGPAGSTGSAGPQGNPTVVNGKSGASITLTAADVSAVPTSAVGVASGVASLDSSGMVPVAQVPGVYLPPTRRLPRYAQPTNILTQFQAGHGFTQQGTGTYVANDTTDYLIPTQSAKITTDGISGSAKIRKAGMTSVDTTGKVLRLRVKIDDITHLKNFEVFLGSSNFANYFMWIAQGTTGGSNFIPSGGSTPGSGWYTVTLHFADATITGSPVRTSLTDLQILAQDDGAGPVTLHVQDVALVPDASAIFPNGVISIGFDDGYGSVYSYGFPKLQQYGYPASLYLIHDMIGTSGRLTLPQVANLQDQYGWEVASHANTDADHAATFTGITAATLYDDLRKMKAWETDNGLRASDGVAYPLGQYGLTSDGQPTSDTVKRFNNYARTVTRKTYETFPPADPLRLRAQSAVTTFTGGYPPATVISTDIAKIKANQLWGIYVFHDITTGAPGSTTQITQADFNSIVDAIASAGVPVIPAGDVLRYFG